MGIAFPLLAFCLIVAPVAFVAGRFMAVGLATVSAMIMLLGGLIWVLTGLEWAGHSEVLWDSSMKAVAMMFCVGLGAFSLFAGSVSGHPSVPAP